MENRLEFLRTLESILKDYAKGDPNLSFRPPSDSFSQVITPSSYSFNVTHNLNTQDVSVEIIDLDVNQPLEQGRQYEYKPTVTNPDNETRIEINPSYHDFYPLRVNVTRDSDYDLTSNYIKINNTCYFFLFTDKNIEVLRSEKCSETPAKLIIVFPFKDWGKNNFKKVEELALALCWFE